ncbi:MAG: ATP-binding cassette domain-containing protein, partial [Gammaproteobacteria bacterium]
QKRISWLGQNPQLLFGSLASNLRLSHPLATDTELLEACRLAQLDDVVLSHAQGLALPVGEKNAGLSGGQAQRLALARMYLKPSSIFILDEPTANLDQHNVVLLHRSLQKMMQQKTTIISTHKKETAQLAQRIILLHEGKIIADGTYNEVTQHILLKHWQEA